MLTITLFCLLVHILKCESTQLADPIVTLQDGSLKGTIGKNYDGDDFYKFFGIPYAKPPINDLRFLPPVSADPWKGIRDASNVGSDCLSRDEFQPTKIVGDEDCLYLNVFTKNLPKNNTSLKPVMVFIYGGGLTAGSSRPGIYGPEFLMLKDIVLVTFNYRIGALGFLNSDDPKLGVFGNMGLKDQNLALKWVQQNIQHFNGDPNDVTIFGHSAGSASVHAHVLSPASNGLFHKAIMQSGSAINSWFWGAKNMAVELISKTGKIASTNQEALGILRNMSALDIFEAQQKIYDSPYPSERRPFAAVIELPNDSAFLTENPIEALMNKHHNDVPIMMGYTQNEGMLLDADRRATEKAGITLPKFSFENIIPHELNISKGSNESGIIRDILWKLYSDKPDSDRYDKMTDGYFLVGIMEGLKLHLKSATKPIYLYRVSLTGELNRLKYLMNRTHEFGVCHGDELGYLFSADITPPVTPDSLEDCSIRHFVELWTNFAIHGNPTQNTKSGEAWEPVQKDNIKVYDIGKISKMTVPPEVNRLEVWRKILKTWPLVDFN
ncbi:unnamed protein product [Ceutorhynchus assimilis]|uniref:Carboxylesterase type B domain-containing protein n=1 Tax=Ceutorhynchus assimilis TaxID=467358 RepID=A0A9N9MN51_9CUCU|nr:unnamed protein product [Ceutorhynchus assimilis]